MKLRPLSAERQPSGNLRRHRQFRKTIRVRLGDRMPVGEEDGGASGIGADRTLTRAEGERDLVVVADAVMTGDRFQGGGNGRQRPGKNPIRIGRPNRVVAVLFDDDGDAGRSLMNRLGMKRGNYADEKERRGERTEHARRRIPRGCEPDDRACHEGMRDCNGRLRFASTKDLLDADSELVDVPEKISDVNPAAGDDHAAESPRLHVEGPEDGAGRRVERGDGLAAGGEDHAVGEGDGSDHRTVERVPPEDFAGAGINGADGADDVGVGAAGRNAAADVESLSVKRGGRKCSLALLRNVAANGDRRDPDRSGREVVAVEGVVAAILLAGPDELPSFCIVEERRRAAQVSVPVVSRWNAGFTAVLKLERVYFDATHGE